MGLLDGLLGGGMRRGGGMSPLTMAVLGLLAYRAMKGRNLTDMFGGSTGKAAGAPAAPGSSGGLGDLLSGGLGGLLGGAGVGGILSGGLGDLLKQFQQNGQGDKAESWVSTAPNKSVSAGELEQALGPERVQWLMQQTGMSKEELLAGLSQELPEVVDKLTPQGRIPSEQEASRMAAA
jgi:uncharacterized protein YidB (DUF937 family)